MITANEARKISQAVEATLEKEVNYVEDNIKAIASQGGYMCIAHVSVRWHAQFKAYMETKGYTAELERPIEPQHDLTSYIIYWA